MSDTIKHTTGTIAAIGSGVGAITLQRVNEWGAMACWIIGCVAGLCTIHSWWRKWNKQNKK